MIEKFIKSIFGDLDSKKLKQYNKDLVKILELEPAFDNFTQEDIQKKTQQFQARFE